jgi:uncharacterized coiled-coil DUF342 family protein
MSVLAPIERSVTKARRRLFLHALVNRLALCWVLALLAGLGWFLAEPWLVESPPDWLKWAVLGGLAGLGTVLGVVLAVRATPSRQAVALELDTRFGLRERVTTAFGLTQTDLATPAGQAVLTDATAKVQTLSVPEKFPVKPRWHSALIPVLAAGLAAVFFFYQPNTARTADDQDPDSGRTKDAAKLNKQDEKKAAPFTKQNKPPELADRPDKSDKLKELENELNEMMRKLDNDPNRETAEKQREKVAELTNAEDKLKKFQQEQFEKLARLEKQLEQLDRLNKDPDFQDGPAKELNDALSKGDLKKAKEEIDELKKKAKDKQLSPEEREQLAKQLDKMKEKVQELQRNKEREQQLKELINKAKAEGKDAESLERELAQLQQEAKQGAEAAKELAQKFEQARRALEKGDLEQVAKELEEAGQSLEQIEGELQDLEDVQDYLQRLKAEREAACKACQGDKRSDEDKGRQDDATGAGRASGRRPEDPNAKTASEDQRIRGLFDPRGKKTYGGTTKGPAFKKATTAELGSAITEAAQEAPKATDSQRLPRDAKDAVKEYFQNLGGQAPGGNK